MTPKTEKLRQVPAFAKRCLAGLPAFAKEEKAMSLPLFESIPQIQDQLAKAAHLLICLDFDGTLAPIALHPAEVQLPPDVAQLLESLVQCPNTSVAIVSGRDRTDLQARVGIAGLIYAGNHGLEISGPGFIFIEPGAVAHRTALGKLATTLAQKLHGFAGVFVEDKGLTLTVHYRLAGDHAADEVKQIVHAALANASHPFLLTVGDKVYEIRPRVYWHKGEAVAWIREKLGKPDALVVYLGDDVTDEDAFEALKNDITVNVGPSGETAARYHLAGPGDVKRFLEWMAHAEGVKCSTA
jgi:trehalose 6-phosphate phosphatase